MKKFIIDFIKRGFLAAGGGPLVLAIVYYFLGCYDLVELLTIKEVVMGIFSTLIMAFVAGGIGVIYKSEKLPLAFETLIHVVVLYLDYLLMYLLNDWIPRNGAAIGIFTAIFVVGFVLIWVVIYFVTKNKTEGINKLRSEKI